MSSIVVTGGNSGIGYYMVKQFLEDGHFVGVLDLELRQINDLKDKFKDKIIGIKCDVSKPEEVSGAVGQIFMQYGSVDYAIHNACLCTFNSLEETSNEIYKKVFGVNYFGAVNLTKSVIPIMKKQGRGKVMLTSSGVGIMGFGSLSPYASSKSAIESFAKCMNIEYMRDGISFHILHPPLTRTKSSAPLPVPNEFMESPEKVGTGLAKKIHKNKFIICHSMLQSLQTRLIYIFPLFFGKLFSKLTANYEEENTIKA